MPVPGVTYDLTVIPGEGAAGEPRPSRAHACGSCRYRQHRRLEDRRGGRPNSEPKPSPRGMLAN